MNQSQSRIDLINEIGPAKIGPVSACLGHHIWNPSFFYQIRSFQSINEHPRAEMYANMAMQRPHPGVISHVLDNEIGGNIWTARRHENSISSLRIIGIDNSTIPFSCADGENPEIMAVQVHGVVDGKDILDNNADGRVVPEIVDVPTGVFGIGCVAGRFEEQDWCTGRFVSIAAGMER